VIAPGSGTRIVIATRPVDFRKQADSLAALVAADLAESPYSGTI
jgi:transposase